jgi:hypothetical protein
MDKCLAQVSLIGPIKDFVKDSTWKKASKFTQMYPPILTEY